MDAVERTVAPWLPVGSDNNGRNIPDCASNRLAKENPETHHEVLSNNVLGVNNYTPASLLLLIKKHNQFIKGSSSSNEPVLLEASTKSNKSNHPEMERFVFQLGAI